MKKNIEKNIIETIPFSAEKINNAKLIWKMNDDKNDYKPLLGLVKKNNIFFEEIETLDHVHVIYNAEFYGGYGIGLNCGGARCGTIRDLQLKGVGLNPTIGSKQNLYNGSGIYPLYEAITEFAMYNIMNKLLPVCPIQHFAIYHIGSTPYFVTAEECNTIQNGRTELSIGVRESTYRVGHFLRAGHYQGNDCYQVPLDIDRVRNNNIRFGNSYQESSDAILKIGNFLLECAKQFSFCRIYRIAHGALTPSNISISGQWLDLTNTTLVPSGYDYRAGMGDPTFLEEKNVVLQIAGEWLDTFNKFNQTNYSFISLQNYYKEQFAEFEDYYICELFGISSSSPKSLHVNIREISKYYNEILINDSKPFKGVPKMIMESGSVITFIENVFKMTFMKYRDSNEVEPQIVDCILSMLKSIYNATNTNLPFKYFIVYHAAVALRQLYYRPYFYIGRIYLHSRDLVAKNINKSAEFINNTNFLTDFIFKKEAFNEYVKLFSNTELSIQFNVCYFYYTVHDNHSERAVSSNKILIVINEIDNEKYIIDGYNFKENVIRLINYLMQLTEERKGLIKNNT